MRVPTESFRSDSSALPVLEAGIDHRKREVGNNYALSDGLVIAMRRVSRHHQSVFMRLHPSGHQSTTKPIGQRRSRITGDAGVKQSKNSLMWRWKSLPHSEKGVLAGLNLREVASGAGVNRGQYLPLLRLDKTCCVLRSIVNSTPSIMSRSDEIISLLALSNVALRTFYGTAVPRLMTASCARCW